MHFEAQSLCSSEYYQIDLSTIICNCSDFPNISLYKHIVMVVHFFGGMDLRPQPPDDESDGTASELGKYEFTGPDCQSYCKWQHCCFCPFGSQSYDKFITAAHNKTAEGYGPENGEITQCNVIAALCPYVLSDSSRQQFMAF